MQSKDFRNLRVFNDILLKEGGTISYENRNSKGSINTDALARLDVALSLGTGNTWYVNSTDGASGNPGTKAQPKATVDQAINIASAGDTIVVLPGHAEDLDAAGDITVDVAGLTFIGLGTGSRRPQITWAAAAATMAISVANITFVNFDFIAGFADVTKMIDVTAGGNLVFDSCNFKEEDTDLNFVDCIAIATGLAGFHFYNCHFRGGDASNDSFITGAGTIDELELKGCTLYMNTAQAAAVGLIDSVGNTTNVDIDNCRFRSNVDGALFVDFNGAANSGCISNCYFSSIDTAGAVAGGFDFTGGHMFECYVAGEADTYGIIGGGTAYNDA